MTDYDSFMAEDARLVILKELARPDQRQPE